MLFANDCLLSPLSAHIGIALPGLLWLGEAVRPVWAHELCFFQAETLIAGARTSQAFFSSGVATTNLQMVAALSSWVLE